MFYVDIATNNVKFKLLKLQSVRETCICIYLKKTVKALPVLNKKHLTTLVKIQGKREKEE